MKLSLKLTQLDFLFNSTILKNRLDPISKEKFKKLKKSEQREFDCLIVVKNILCLVNWKDNNIGVKPVEKVMRWSARYKKRIDVNCHTIATNYNI